MSATIREMCEAIAAEVQKRGMTIRNLKTGLVVKTAEDVYNFDSQGEWMHVFDWYARLCPEQYIADLEPIRRQVKE